MNHKREDFFAPWSKYKLASFSFFLSCSGSEDFSGVVGVEFFSNIGQVAVEAFGRY